MKYIWNKFLDLFKPKYLSQVIGIQKNKNGETTVLIECIFPETSNKCYTVYCKKFYNVKCPFKYNQVFKISKKELFEWTKI